MAWANTGTEKARRPVRAVSNILNGLIHLYRSAPLWHAALNSCHGPPLSPITEYVMRWQLAILATRQRRLVTCHTLLLCKQTQECTQCTKMSLCANGTYVTTSTLRCVFNSDALGYLVFFPCNYQLQWGAFRYQSTRMITSRLKT